MAQFWEKHRQSIRQMFAPVTHALVEDAWINPGQTVLDIATGPGEPALTVAYLVGSAGKVAGIDPALEMIEAAQREARRLGSTNLTFDVASADQIPFADNTFDAVVSRFGVMFCPSPVDAVREILRVLKPGGRMALAAWHFAAQNPFFYTLSQVIDRFLDSSPLEPDADPFRFAPPGLLRDVLAQAGAMDPSERVLQFKIEAPLSPQDFLALRFEMSDSLRKKLALLSPEQLTEVNRQSLEALQDYSTDRRVSFPAEVRIVSGTRRHA